MWHSTVFGLVCPTEAVEHSLGADNDASVAPTGLLSLRSRSAASTPGGSSSEDEEDAASASSRSSVGNFSGTRNDGWRAAFGDVISVPDEVDSAMPNEKLAHSSDF